MKKFLTLFLILSIVFTLGCKKDQPVEVIEQEKIREEQGVNKINSLGPVDTIKSMYQSLKNGDLDTFHFLSENILEKINEDDSFLEYLVERLDFMDEQLIEELQESEIETSYLYILENEYGNYADDFVVVVEYSNLPYAAWGWVLKHTETGLKVVDLTRAYIGEIVKGGMMPEEIEIEQPEPIEVVDNSLYEDELYSIPYFVVAKLYEAALFRDTESFLTIAGQYPGLDSSNVQQFMSELAEDVIAVGGVNSLMLETVPLELLVEEEQAYINEAYMGKAAVVINWLEDEYIYAWLLAEIDGHYYVVGGDDYHPSEILSEAYREMLFDNGDY